MNSPLKSFLVMTRSGDAAALALGQEVAAWLGGRGASAQLCEHRSIRGAGACQLPDGTFDAVLVLGGDGTFIGVARMGLGRGLPLLGLNLGRVGFLAEPAGDWPRSLAALLAGAYALSRRVCLAYEVRRRGETVCSGRAINDLVVSRGELARLIRLLVLRDGERVGAMRSDGLIISTPTGSTAYGFSAGGPLVHPEMEALCLTPVCPFLNNFRPVVLPASGEICVVVEEQAGEVRLSVDGQRSFALEPGDVVHVRRAPDDLLLAETDGTSYFAKLASKGFFTER
ncbi:MAG: NAD(+)/NADH kinase [Humidesulfovibrio sp.]